MADAADATIAPTMQQKLTAEVIGTFVLVFLGCGSVVYSTNVQQINPGVLPPTITTVALTFGVAVMIMAYAFGRVSGAHFNPAVSVGAGISGRIAWREVGAYILAQLVGAVLGALVLFILMHGFDGYSAENNMGQNGYGSQSAGDYAWWGAFLLEMVITAVFVLVILAVTDTRNEHPSLAPLAIGFTLAAIHFVAIPATGTSANPARSIGPALFAGGDAIVQLWLFILAPLLGAAIAGVAYPLLFGRSGEVVPGSGISFSRPRTAAQVPGQAAPDQYQQQWHQDAGAAATGASAGYAEPAAAEPIIQDGWQWDPVGQQWHPVGSTPEQWRAQQAAEQAQQQAAQQSAQQPAEGDASSGWPESEAGDGGTQIRPPS
jgi:aquaporin Z